LRKLPMDRGICEADVPSFPWLMLSLVFRDKVIDRAAKIDNAVNRTGKFRHDGKRFSRAFIIIRPMGNTVTKAANAMVTVRTHRPIRCHLLHMRMVRAKSKHPIHRPRCIKNLNILTTKNISH